MKVYCRDCKFWKSFCGRLECHFNKKEVVEDLPIQPIYHTEFQDFKVKNKDNNCPDFKKTFLRFWR